jgi:hypothetical protein
MVLLGKMKGSIMKTAVAGLLLLFLPALATASPAARPLAVERIAGDQGGAGTQFIRADGSGRVFLLRGDTGDVRSVSKGRIGEAVPLKTANSSLGHVLNAALSPNGSQWLLYAEGRLRLFAYGKETPLPQIDWQPWSVGFVRDTPLVGVMPRPLPAAAMRIKDLGTVPWLVTLDNDRWSTLVDHPNLKAETAWRERGRMTAWVAEYSSLLYPSRDGGLWTAREYGYLLRKIGSSGRTLSEVSIPEKKKEERPARISTGREPAEAVRRMEAQGGTATFHEFTEQAVVADIVEKSGVVFLLIYTPGGKLALDRYDPGLARLERVPLAMKGSGRFTLAAGKDGLYVAPMNTAEGVWKVSWDVLDGAAWKAVEGARVPGGAGDVN